MTDRFKAGRLAAVLALAAICALALAGCGGGGSTARELPGYLNECLVSGNVVRWTRMPVSVYLNTTDKPENWKDEYEYLFIEAMNEWAAASGGSLSFRLVDEPAYPCISVRWVKTSPLGNAGAAGVAKFESVYYLGRRYFDIVYVEIATTTTSGQPYNSLQMRVVSIHELGHAIGLWGHSLNPGDIMYGGGPITTTGLSSNDILSVCSLYSLNPDLSEVPIGYIPRTRSVSEFQIE